MRTGCTNRKIKKQALSLLLIFYLQSLQMMGKY